MLSTTKTMQKTTKIYRHRLYQGNLKRIIKDYCKKKLGKDIARIEHRASNKSRASSGGGKNGKPMTKKKKTTNKDSLKQLKKKNKQVLINEKPMSQKEKKKDAKWGGSKQNNNNKWGVSSSSKSAKRNKSGKSKGSKGSGWGDDCVCVQWGDEWYSTGKSGKSKVSKGWNSSTVTSVGNGIVIMMNMMMIGTGEDHRRSRHGDHGRNLVIPLLVHQQ